MPIVLHFIDDFIANELIIYTLQVLLKHIFAVELLFAGAHWQCSLWCVLLFLRFIINPFEIPLNTHICTRMCPCMRNTLALRLSVSSSMNRKHPRCFCKKHLLPFRDIIRKEQQELCIAKTIARHKLIPTNAKASRILFHVLLRVFFNMCALV